MLLPIVHPTPTPSSPEELIVPLAVGAVVAVGLVVRGRREARREAVRKAAWDALAPQLQWDEATGSGELEGYRLEVRRWRRPAISLSKQPRVVEVRALPHHPLPNGFLIAPRRWLGVLETVGVDGLLDAPSRTLQQRYVFQCDRGEEARVLLAHPEVVAALEALPFDLARRGRRTSYVEHGAIGTGWVQFVSAEHSYLEPLLRAVAVARAFDRAAGALAERRTSDSALWRALTTPEAGR